MAAAAGTATRTGLTIGTTDVEGRLLAFGDVDRPAGGRLGLAFGFVGVDWVAGFRVLTGVVRVAELDVEPDACGCVVTGVYEEVGLGDAIGIIARRLGLGVTETWAPTAPTILFEVRLPRVLAGLVVGAGLGAAGVVLQALLRNPMADPYVIGAAAGASLGAVLAITAPIVLPVLAIGAGTAWLGIGLVQVAAFIGGLGAVLTLIFR